MDRMRHSLLDRVNADTDIKMQTQIHTYVPHHYCHKNDKSVLSNLKIILCDRFLKYSKIKTNCPVISSVSITGSIPLLVYYQSPRVSSAQQSVFLSLSRYLCWFTISPRGYHPPSSQYYYHWVDISAGGQLVPEAITPSPTPPLQSVCRH